MKKLITTLASALLPFAAFAQQPAAPQPPLVSVSGTAETNVVPDIADLRFSVEHRAPDLKTARAQQAATAAKVVAALRAAGVAETDLRSADISIEPNYSDGSRDRIETAKVRFFGVSQDIAVSIKDVKKVPDVIAAAMEAGATALRNVGLRSSEIIKHRAEARTKAVLAAKAKAEALAEPLGAKVGRPFKISEDKPAFFSGISANVISNDAAFAVSQPSEAAFAPGTVNVSVTVDVSFYLE